MEGYAESWVAVAGLGEMALCAFIVIGGVVRAAVNARHEERALAHIRQHVARGVVGVQLCSVDCVVRESTGRRPMED